MRRDITKQDTDNMTPEELEELKRQASIAIVKRFVAIFIFKVVINALISRWARKLRDS